MFICGKTIIKSKRIIRRSFIRVVTSEEPDATFLNLGYKYLGVHFSIISFLKKCVYCFLLRTFFKIRS